MSSMDDLEIALADNQDMDTRWPATRTGDYWMDEGQSDLLI